MCVVYRAMDHLSISDFVCDRISNTPRQPAGQPQEQSYAPASSADSDSEWNRPRTQERDATKSTAADVTAAVLSRSYSVELRRKNMPRQFQAIQPAFLQRGQRPRPPPPEPLRAV